MKKRGTIYVWTGIGAGKTTSALGVALRESGQGNKVIIIQFMKTNGERGETKIAKKLKDFEVHQVGTKHWRELHSPSRTDKKHAMEGLKLAEKALKKNPALLVLDEINLAVSYGLLTSKEVIKVLQKTPEKTSVFLTGRFAPLEIMEFADYVTEFVTIKKPKGMK